MKPGRQQLVEVLVEERCSRCFQVVPLGENDRRPPWCPHCGADFVPAPPLPPELARPISDDELADQPRLRAAAKPQVNIVSLVVAVVLGAVLLSMVKDWVNADPEKEFCETQLARLQSLREHPPASIRFTSLDKEVIVTEPAEIKAFLDMLCEAKPVHAHHSHAVRPVMVWFAGHPDRYFLGTDSQNEHEHWLKMQQAERPEPDFARRVIQFQSQPMTEWLQRTKVAEMPR
ncbi:MAG: hypothetical protein U0792_21135 [Gemmataceae bacterium]